MLTLNVIEQTQMMVNAQVAQIRQMSRKRYPPPKKTNKNKTKKNTLFKIVKTNCKLKLHEIAEELKISEGSVFLILHEHLSMIKLCSKWVLCLFIVGQN